MPTIDGRLVLEGPSGRCVAARVTVRGVGGAPVAVDLGEALGGTRAEAGALDRAARWSGRGSSRRAPSHPSAAYRKDVAGVLARRALALAPWRATPAAA